MKRITGLAVVSGLFAVAQQPSKDVWIMPDGQVNSTFVSIRTADPKKPSVSKVVGTFAGHSLSLIQRNGNGVVEVHLHKHDMFFVRQGTATLIVGGEVVNGKDTGGGEIRGDSIRNGTKRTIHTGDIVQIPATVPHQILLNPGDTVAYAAVKVDAP
jgi:mannose-6-phosphate isomerase-like protein (cupin superfamily)